MSLFQLVTDYKPSGDQEQAIAKLLKSLEAGNRHQCLLGVTGSGATAPPRRGYDMPPTFVGSNSGSLALACKKRALPSPLNYHLYKFCGRLNLHAVK